MRASKPAHTPAFVLWTDGSARDCDLGWGAVLWRKDEAEAQTLSGGERLAREPSHGSEVAEWVAAARGLALVRAKKQPVLVLSDSQSVVNFINGVAASNAVDMDACLARVGSRAFFQLGKEVSSFETVQALKVKGHAGSCGNLLVDQLANQGRAALADARGVTDGALLTREVQTLLESGSTNYSVTRHHPVPVRTAKAPVTRAPRTPKPAALKLSPAQIRDLTRGMTFELSLLEKSRIAARAAELLEKAEGLPGHKPAQVKKRKLAVHRAKSYAKNATKTLLQLNRKAAAEQLLAAQSSLAS